MKSFLTFSLATLFLLHLGCASHEQLVKDPPFSVVSTTLSEETDSLTVTMTISQVPGDVNFVNLYFKGKKTAIYGDNGIYTAKFFTAKKDVILSGDMSEEAANPHPQLPEKPPVAMSDNQALLVYSEAGKQWYYIIDRIIRDE